MSTLAIPWHQKHKDPSRNTREIESATKKLNEGFLGFRIQATGTFFGAEAWLSSYLSKP